MFMFNFLQNYRINTKNMHGSDKKMLKKEDSFCCFSYFWGVEKMSLLDLKF